MIYHITTPALWQSAIDKGFYETASLPMEGFIHCCSKEQIKPVIERYYSDLKQLIVLDINENKLTSAIKYEPSPNVNEMFPHIYGIINLDAVENINTIINN